MNRQDIINYLETSIGYTKFSEKHLYLVSEWHKFKPENLALLQSIKENEMPHIELDVTNSLLRLKRQDRKSTRLNSSHRCISHAVFCLKKKKKKKHT